MGITYGEELPALDLGQTAEGVGGVAGDGDDNPPLRSEGGVSGGSVDDGRDGSEGDLRVGDGFADGLGLGFEAEESGVVADVAEEEDGGDSADEEADGDDLVEVVGEPGGEVEGFGVG